MVVPLPEASDDPRSLTTAVLTDLRHIFRKEYGFKKCGVMLMELSVKAQHQETLFDDVAAR